MTRKDVLIIQAQFLMTKENIEKTYNQFIKQMESGLLMLPSGYTVIQCPKDIDVKFSGDAISRQALKDLGAECIAKRDENGNLIPLGCIDNLPSVSTEKTGRWKRVSIDKYIQHAMAYYKCSECGGQTIGQTEYCPNCGAKMQEVEE